MRENMMHDGGGIPADFEKDPVAAAASAATTSAQSYTKVIKMVPVVGKTYKFWFTYLYEDPETKQVTESANSPIFSTSFTIPNETLPVENLVLTSGIKSYGIKFDVNPASKHADIIIFESLTGAFTGEEYIVYTGTSTSITVQVDSFAPRWVKVTTRDNWRDINRSSVTAGPVNILANDPDTSTPPLPPAGAKGLGSLDPQDKSGFSGQLDVSWTANTDPNTGGYIIRWSTDNPVSVTNPLWEYGQVEGRATTKFTVTGLLPNTLYYYQVTAKSPYNALSWASAVTDTFGPISDPNAPADVWAQLRSILSIGGKTADLFRIGTGIAQKINVSTTTTEDQRTGTYSGIILNKSTTNFGHNYWLNTGQFRVGTSSAFLYWDGFDVYTTGKINATGGSFTGDVRLNGGTLYTGPTPLTGARVRFDSAGLFGYDTTSTSNTTGQTFALTAADGKIDARLGYIGGWTIQGTAQTVGTISKNGTILGSDGSIVLGDTTGTLASIVKLSSTDPTYRIWVGNQLARDAKFKVGVDGIVYASGAVIDGNASFSGTLTIGTLLSDGTALDTTRANALAAIGAAGAAAEKAEIARLKGVEAYDKAVAAGDSAAAAKKKAEDAEAIAVLKITRGEVNTVLASDTTIINGSAITTGTINLARLNITGGTAGVNGFVVDGNGIRAYNGSSQTLNIDSSGSISLGDTTNGWTVDNRYIKSRSYYADGYTQIKLDGWNGSITGGRISGTTIEAATIKGNTISGGTITGTTISGGTITGSTVQTSTSSTNVKLQNAGVDSLEVTLSGTTVGHLYGVNLAGGAMILQGGSADPSSTNPAYGRVYVAGSIASIAGGISTSVLLNGIDSTTKIFGSGGIYTDTIGTFYMRSGDTTAASANMQIVSTAGDTFGKVARSTSSRRYKTNIETVSFPDEAIKSLRPTKYQGIKDMERGDNTWYTGLIAEEVAEIPGLELLVQYNDEGQPEAVNYAGLSVVLAQVVSRILDRLDALEA